MRILICCVIFLSLVSCTNKRPHSAIHYPEGGYSYSPILGNDTDFLFYPLRDSFSTKDSFRLACKDPFFLACFNEPNLSLRPMKESVFRLICNEEGLYYTHPVIIILKQDEIVIKEGIKGYAFYEYDTVRLNPLERKDYEMLYNNYPLNKPTNNPYRKRYIDSLTKERPELIDAQYYKRLLDKSKFILEQFDYKLSTIVISPVAYQQLVKQINESGYWRLPYDYTCEDIPSDASGFTLEANTSVKYNMVSSAVCPDDTSRFVKACQALVDAAGLKDKVHLVWSTKGEKAVPVLPKEIELEEIQDSGYNKTHR